MISPAGPDPAAFADLLAGYCLDVRPRQRVLIGATALATPLLLELERAILEREAWPLVRVALPGEQRLFYAYARDVHLDSFDELALTEVEKADARLGIQAPHDTRELAGVDPELIMRVARSRRPLREAGMRRRWCGTLWPTEALAAQAGMCFDDFAAFVRRALFLDRDDAPRAWRELGAFQDELIARLRGVRELRIEADGTDLTLSVAGRTWVNSDGRRNMPSGEVFTGPLEDSAAGRVRFTVPSAPAGVAVAGVELELRAGEVVAARAAEGEQYLQRALRTDPGARRLGEVGIGTNRGIDRPVGVTLFDEKIGGTLHLALGRSYPETGGTNVSALHWDLILDLRAGGRLSGDGATIMENGVFA